jgi:hypothetical protein
LVEERIHSQRDRRSLRVTLPEGSFTPVLAIQSGGSTTVLPGSRLELSIEDTYRLSHLLAELAEEAEQRRAKWEMDRAFPATR